jgi:hypothetical protein
MGGLVGLILLGLFFSIAAYGERKSGQRHRQELMMAAERADAMDQ